MRRREFLPFLTFCAATAYSTFPRRLAAQRVQVRKIGVMLGSSEDDPEAKARVGAFIQALSGLGWEVSRNLKIEYRWAGADPEKMLPLAREIVALDPDLIVTTTTPVTTAVQRETKTIPIVFNTVSDPIGAGIVASLSRPAGNTTGLINFEGAMGGKWLEILKEISPNLTRVAIMFNPDTAPGGGQYFLPSFEAAARTMNVKPIAAKVHSAEDIENLIVSTASEPDSGLVIMSDSFFVLNRRQVYSLAVQHKLPVVYNNISHAREGGLVAYGPNIKDQFRKTADFVDRILKGDKPADLPVQLPTKFEFAINLKTAKALGLSIPPALLVMADEVIE